MGDQRKSTRFRRAYLAKFTTLLKSRIRLTKNSTTNKHALMGRYYSETEVARDTGTKHRTPVTDRRKEQAPLPRIGVVEVGRRQR